MARATDSGTSRPQSRRRDVRHYPVHMHHALPLLTDWMPRQRWFAATGGASRLRLLAEIPMDGAAPHAEVSVLLIADDATDRPVVYQVPVVVRRDPSPALRAAVIGTTSDGMTLLDGPHDPAFTRALMRQIAPGVEATAEVLRGEQSNTSIIFRPTEGRPVICKVFRQVEEGTNPDIELQTVLTDAGSSHVPAVIGAVTGSWTDPLVCAHIASGSLAFAQEFFPSVSDAWRVALGAAADDADFTAAAADLGRTTADIHRDLARLLPTRPATGAARETVAAAWRRRLDIALVEVPALRPHEAAIRARYADAMGVGWPDLQRIHGDYHLGQVLQVPGRGWVLLDFEGEPMRPIGERREPDLALRDIAGMLRSFDYVAGSVLQERPSSVSAVLAWAEAARTAFLAGYAVAMPGTAGGPLLAALELEKAVYEAIYEARHRPGWLSIPLAAVERLAED